MKSVITKFEAKESERVIDKGFVRTPYALEVRGAAVPNALVYSLLDMDTGALTVTVQVPKEGGKPVLALSTMDALARRVKPDARAYAGNKGGAAVVRRYS